jgi:hypothetical protein
LPLPLHAFQLIALFDQLGPEFPEQSDFAPMLEATVDSAVIAVHAWDMVPLAACSQPKDDPVQRPTSIRTPATRRGRRIQSPQQPLDPFP